MSKTAEMHLVPAHSPGQQEVFDWTGHGVLFAGRRWGKTEVGSQKLYTGAMGLPGLYWWCGLSWRSASLKRAWRLIKQYTRETWRLLGRDPSKFIREADKECRLPGDAEIWLRTAENAPSLAGEGVRGVVLDEFSLMAENVWTEYVQATLIDYGGWALFMGVPKGQNWAANLWRAAHTRKGWRAWQYSSYDNPFLDAASIDAIKTTIPERLFKQEYLADVVDDAGSVFRRVVECATAAGQERAVPGHAYVIGVDWAGPGRDFSCFTVVDASEKALVYMDRFNGVDYNLQSTRLRALNDRFGPSKIMAEANSMGQPVIDRLQAMGLPVVAFTTTNESKQLIVDGLVLAFEQGTIRVIPDDTLISELQAFEATRLPSGKVRYAAPESGGLHDDCVMSLALSWHAGCGRKQYAPPGYCSYIR